jgi:cyanophycinase
MFPVLQKKPHLLGIGLDEATAVVVSGSRFEVIGKSYVAIYNSRLNTDQFPMLSENDFRPFHLLMEGDMFDLASRTIIQEKNQ